MILQVTTRRSGRAFPSPTPLPMPFCRGEGPKAGGRAAGGGWEANACGVDTSPTCRLAAAPSAGSADPLMWSAWGKATAAAMLVGWASGVG